MPQSLTELEKQVIATIQGDIPVVEHPYKTLALRLGISEDRLLAVLKDLVRRGIIRRFGATLRHQKSGFGANAMVAWQVDESRIDEVGRLMASFAAVSHCYRRNPAERWPYNLYTMVHGQDEAGCRRTAAEMAQKAQVHYYALLFSRREFKKISMQYFQTLEGSKGA